MKERQVRTTKPDILIVDDTPENLRLLSKMLIEEGYNVRKALNGQMALTAVEALVPDLILLDIMMPNMDGYQVCEKIKSEGNTNEIPIIFLSALDGGFDKVKAFSVGGADYITKPFQVEEVLVRVENQLALRAARIENKILNNKLEERVKERTNQLEVAYLELKREIAERKLLQAELTKMAMQDALTGLPNRILFMERLQEALKLAKSNKNYHFGVLFLDCDRFKIVNDSLGHLVGDELLIALARRLESCMDATNTLSRLGGDEFAILLTEIDSVKAVIQVADRILEALSYPFNLTRQEVFINASIGIAIGNSSYERAEHLLRDADTAMYRAKNLGKGQYRIFDPAMHEAAIQVLQLETDLRKAIDRDELILHYQPIVSLNEGKIIGFEALVRWYHPIKGMVSPAAFIPVAEETGLINSIGNFVLRVACYQLRLWQKAKIVDYPLTMSVNLSARQFADTNLVEGIDLILQEAGINPQFLKLEITESAIVNNPQSAKAILQQLRDRQIQLCIDDFGTGYSSLSYLHNFPLDIIKIDRSFVSRMDRSPENLGLIPVIIKIAETMKMSAIAEGIETPQQLAQLRELNCDFGQGYLFAKPLEAKTATELLASCIQW